MVCNRSNFKQMLQIFKTFNAVSSQILKILIIFDIRLNKDQGITYLMIIYKYNRYCWQGDPFCRSDWSAFSNRCDFNLKMYWLIRTSKETVKTSCNCTNWNSCIYFGPPVYPMGSIVIALVRPLVRPLVRQSLNISEKW